MPQLEKLSPSFLEKLSPSSFKIICQDSLKWLDQQPDGSVPNVITGIPDLNELEEGMTMNQYLEFFIKASSLIFQKINPKGYAIFIQTDRRYEGQLIDKSYWLTHTAYENDHKLLWHKIVCVRNVGKIDLFRPTYSHFLCYSKQGTPGAAFEDVFAVGGKLYDNATPFNVSQAAALFVSKYSKVRANGSGEYDVVDPFVGQGTTACSVITHNLSFLGLDLDPEQCELTKALLSEVVNL